MIIWAKIIGSSVIFAADTRNGEILLFKISLCFSLGEITARDNILKIHLLFIFEFVVY